MTREQDMPELCTWVYKFQCILSGFARRNVG